MSDEVEYFSLEEIIALRQNLASFANTSTEIKKAIETLDAYINRTITNITKD